MNFVFAFALMLVASFLQSMMTPAQQKPKAAALDKFDFPQIDEGTPQAVVFGDVWIEDWMVLWYGNLRHEAIKAKAGKK